MSLEGDFSARSATSTPSPIQKCKLSVLVEVFIHSRANSISSNNLYASNTHYKIYHFSGIHLSTHLPSLNPL